MIVEPESVLQTHARGVKNKLPRFRAKAILNLQISMSALLPLKEKTESLNNMHST